METVGALREKQLDLAIATLARIGFLTQRWPGPRPKEIARNAIAEIAKLQDQIDAQQQQGPSVG